MRNPGSGRAPGSRGVALIAVLVVIVLITVVLVGFMVNSSMERTSSASYHAASATRLMADTAVNLVQGQINEAVSQCNDAKHAWASQPGAIRVYDNAGNLGKIYRLYSAPSLVTSTAGDLVNDLPQNVSPPGKYSNWSSFPALWVDLNAPVNDASGVAHFPILDAGVAANVDGFSVDSASAVSGATKTQVPMPVRWLYVLQNGQIIPPDPGGDGNTVTFTKAATVPSAANPIVGRIAYWADDDTCKVNINTAAGDGVMGSPNDAANIANATFWDAPRFCAADEIALAQDQPASGEFQRYPGHPATVALNNILAGLGWNLGFSTTAGTPNFYALTPRYAYGGSKAGTTSVTTAGSIPLASNRLYASVAEMLFQPTAARSVSVLNADNVATRQRIETANFFLTAHSRAPEVNLFGQPRVSIWPAWDTTVSNPTVTTTSARTAIDQLLAFCATTGTGSNTAKYYFTRADNSSSYTDVSLARNQTLLSYLDYLTFSASGGAGPIPGFGGNFDGKYTQSVTRQILTEMFDYVRTINEVDSSSGATVYGQQWNQMGGATAPDYGFAQVAPSILSTSNTSLAATSPLQSWGTQGEGFFPRLTEVSLQFIAMGRGALPGGSSAIALQSIYNTHTGLFGAGDSGADPTNAGNPAKNTITAVTVGAVTQQIPPGNTAAGTQATMAVQALLLLNFINPSETRLANPAVAGGANTVDPFVAVEVAGLNNLKLTGSIANTPSSLGFTADDSMIMGTTNNNFSTGPFFSLLGIRSMMTQCFSASTGRVFANGYTATSGSASAKFTAAYKDFPFYSKILPIAIPASGTGGTMILNSATVTIKVYDGSSHATGSSLGNLVQTYTVNIPGGTFPVPTPDTTGTLGPPVVGLGNVGTPTPPPDIWWPGSSDSNQNSTGGGLLIRNGLGSNLNSSYTAGGTITAVNATKANGQDTVESMVLSAAAAWTDPRLLAAASVPTTAFTTHPNWGQAMAHSLCYGPGVPFPGATATGALAKGATYNVSPGVSTSTTPIVLSSVNGATTTGGALGDWDNGLGNDSDGPWINKSDEGEVYASGTVLNLPYFAAAGKTTTTGAAFFSPNREVPSPGMFGSLPTGVDPLGANPKPWQTLLFRPGPSNLAGLTAHPGEASPSDFLFLDLFWMPVAEPYAISEPFSTAGKVNLNYEIEPFTYITRSTALRAVLSTEKVAAVDVGQSKLYKVAKYDTTTVASGMASNARYPIDLNITMPQFQSVFTGTLSGTPDIFRSASQICSIYLVPENMGYAQPSASTDLTGVTAFAKDWYGAGGTTKFALVGDNVRERPYADIYSRVTTKSNSYTVYYTVQALKNAQPAANQNQWVESTGSVLGEYRGSTSLERYINPDSASLPDFATNPGSKGTVEPYYWWRIVANSQFSP